MKLLCYKNRSGYSIDFENLALDNLMSYVENGDTRHPEYLLLEHDYFNIISKIKECLNQRLMIKKIRNL